MSENGLLLPCPFCAEKEQIIWVKRDRIEIGVRRVVELPDLIRCKTCGAEAPPEVWNRRATPDGWKLMPITPTEAMIEAGKHNCGRIIYNEFFDNAPGGWEGAPDKCWSAMSEAAPAYPPEAA